MIYDNTFDPQYCEICQDEINKDRKLCYRCEQEHDENGEYIGE